ncbi:MAG: NAD(P)H-binding protein [Bacteroidota bacterium]
MPSELILVTGANGYIASRLIPRLLERGFRVRALARRPERLAGRAWLRGVEVVQGDVHDPEGLGGALAGVHTAYYLIHSMSSGQGYTRIEREAAGRFAQAADKAGLYHIIYLGGLADPNARNLAPHMRSRMETGETLRAGRVPVTEFRAGVIAGPGSISFEMIRFLTEFFPVLPGPRWLRNKAQPIAAANVVDYLEAALHHPEARGGIYEMGGPEVMQYADTMLQYARRRGLKRILFTLPGIPIWLMARLVDWLTPVPYPIATPLVGGLQSDSVVLDHAAQRAFPEVKLIPYERAILDSLDALNPDQLERVWEGVRCEVVRMKHEGFFIDYRHVTVQAPPERVYEVIESLGEDSQWLRGERLWQPQPGDDAGPCGLEEGKPSRMIRIQARPWAPGEGWIEWRMEDSTLKQTSFFAPRGMGGFLYWHGLAPMHQAIFRGLLRKIKRRSEEG